MPIEPARLARLGFVDAQRADGILRELGPIADEALVPSLAEAADPDLALRSLGRILAADPDPAPLRAALTGDTEFRDGMAALLGVSEALADHLVRHPQNWVLLEGLAAVLSPAEMRADVLVAVGARPDDPHPTATLAHGEALLQLRRSYRRFVLQIARRDIVGAATYDDVVAQLSAAADAALEGALAIARAEVGPASRGCRLAVIAMGKCGGQELNYVSDVDVIFVAAPSGGGGDESEAIRVGASLATALMRACSATTAEGSLWEVDAGLRPEGRAGVLVRTLDSHIGYYERWAQTWEYQALLKARPAAGDLGLGRAYVDATSEFVWSAAGRPNFVDDVQAMRRRVEESVARQGRQLKLGRGGLRDVEFSVQLLQLVHGRSDVMLRSANTMRALEALASYGYVARKDAAGLGQAYRFLRTLEHRLQVFRLRRVHVVPESEQELRRVARSMGFRTDPVAEFDARWRAVSVDVRRLHEKLFYRPLLQAVARLEPGEARLTLEAAGQRLIALGYAAPEAALQHLEALTSGVSRRAAIQRTLLPVLLDWFADSPDPDGALLGFRQVSDALGATPWYLRLIRDESVAAQRLAEILGASRFASELLHRAPEAVAMLGSNADLGPRTAEALESEALSSATRHDDPEEAIAAVRAFRRRELFRTSVADVLGLSDVGDTAEGLTDLTGASLAAGLQAAVASVSKRHGSKLGVRFVVIGMGRFGGRDMAYSSDADVMFVCDPLPGTTDGVALRQALEIANDLRTLLSLPSADPPLMIDADLRPEGRNGPLVRSLASYRAYYQRWSSPWEAQALIRARPVCGDPRLGQEFLDIIDPVRYPVELRTGHVREMRRLKARMESERLPRGADPALHVKMGRGGLADVEWTVQLIQLRHAHEVASLRTTQTMPALEAATDAGLLAEADADVLAAAWRLASRIRNATMLATGRASDTVPSQRRTLAAVAHLLGYGQAERDRLVEDYRRTARRARKVVERVFYDGT